MRHTIPNPPAQANEQQGELPRRHPYQVTIAGRPCAANERLVDRLAVALSTEFLVGRTRVPAADLFDPHDGLLDYDLVLHQGTADLDLPTVLLLDQDGDEVSPLHDGVIATVGAGAGARIGDATGPSAELQGIPVPHHRPDDVAGIAATIRAHLLALADRKPVYGLVLTGGNSRRMGRPKWALEYQGAPHALHLLELLELHCQQAFLSINHDQQRETALTRRPHLVDRFVDVGPLGGILTAMSTYPDVAWLVLACDLPFVRSATIARLLAGRAPLRFATAYRNPHDALPEPLCTIYEVKARGRLFQLLALGRARPRELLRNSRIELLTNPDEDELVNANDEVEYERARARLGAKEAG